MPDDVVLGARQFKNPNDTKVKEDTDQPDVPKPVGSKMNVSNPPAAFAMPRPQARHPHGHGVPKSMLKKFSAEITEN